MTPKKYNYKDFFYDVAYIAVLIGLVLILISYFPEIFERLLPFLK